MRLVGALVLGGLVLGSTPVFAQPVPRWRTGLRAIVDGGIAVHFEGMRGASGDWIALARAGSGPTEYVTYQYPGERTHGVLTFADPGEGDYVVRAYFGSSSYVVRAETPPFHVTDRCRGDHGDGPRVSATRDGANVFVRFSGLCGTPTDWIAIAPLGAAAQSYQAWQYTNGARDGVIQLANVPPGQWVARIFTNWSATHSYDVRAESAPFWVAPPGCVCGEAAVAAARE